MLAANGVGVAVEGISLLQDISVRLRSGRMLAVMGPNGAGKSTLLRVLAGDLPPTSGEVAYDELPITSLSSVERARRRAVVMQRSPIAHGFSALETVLIGRYPHGGNGELGADRAIASRALARAGAAEFDSRSVETLSGGEFARVVLARALAQIDGVEGPRYLLLDEPTVALDPAHQHDVMRLLSGLARDEQVGILVILHDFNLAARYADDVVLMRAGSVVADGLPDEVLVPALIAQVFGVEAIVLAHPSDSCPVIVVNG
ncbi:MAG: heme ABC transporter ATP-binding protein [Betaproteobacteria bacterium]